MRVIGGAGGVTARLEDLDALAQALVTAAGDAVALAGSAVRAVGDPALLAAVPTDPSTVARAVAEAGRGAGGLCRGAGVLAGLSGSVARAVATYRAREDALAALARGVPLAAGSALRVGLALATVPLPGAPPTVWLLTGAGAGAIAGAGLGVGLGAGLRAGLGAGLGAVDPGTDASLDAAVDAALESAESAVRSGVEAAIAAGVDVVVGRPWLVDGAVRLLPGLLGVADVPTAARAVGVLGQGSGLLVETPVAVTDLGPAAPCTDPGGTDPGGTDPGGTDPGRAAGGVADLLRRGQTVAAWRTPSPGGHDSLPPGQVRPEPGQVRVDRVEGADGTVAWVVHVPGTQDWDGDGEGSPMDMAANVALVGGRRTAVAEGVATALVGAGARPGQPVALVGHSQGGMVALDLASDQGLRRVVTVTHVVTAGSPVTGRTPPPGVQVLALEHDDDLVPRLDGQRHPDRRDRVVVRTPAPDGPWRTDAVPAHSSSAYVVTGAAVDASDHPSLVAFRRGLAGFLDREGATCRSTQVILERVPGRADGRR